METEILYTARLWKELFQWKRLSIMTLHIANQLVIVEDKIELYRDNIDDVSLRNTMCKYMFSLNDELHMFSANIEHLQFNDEIDKRILIIFNRYCSERITEKYVLGNIGKRDDSVLDKALKVITSNINLIQRKISDENI